MDKFESHQDKEIKDYYEENGYVVIKKLVPQPSIDAFLVEYEKIKNNKYFLYYSQSIHRVIRPTVTPEGFIKESMENATRLTFHPKFTSAIKTCLFDEGISNNLSTISGNDKHIMSQNMFFDLSTGTIDHQDHWYLDTVPPGHLIGTWYALEDIHEDAGCFFVLPGSHKGELLSPDDFENMEAFRKANVKMMENTSYTTQSLPLEKGDVIFWHPFTIHGSHPNVNPQHSRKSFTAHFYPHGMKYREKDSSKKILIKDTFNPKVMTGHYYHDITWSLKNYVKYFLRDSIHAKKALRDMRKSSYKE